jgi:hypothetical protein
MKLFGFILFVFELIWIISILRRCGKLFVEIDIKEPDTLRKLWIFYPFLKLLPSLFFWLILFGWYIKIQDKNLKKRCLKKQIEGGFFIVYFIFISHMEVFRMLRDIL